MPDAITLNINGKRYTLDIDPATPLLYVLRNDCGLFSPKYGCGVEQCGACKALIDGEAVPTCQLPVRDVVNAKIVTLEGLGTADQLHPELVKAIQEHIERYELEGIFDNILICCETISTKEQKKLFGKKTDIEIGGVILTPKWLIWAGG